MKAKLIVVGALVALFAVPALAQTPPAETNCAARSPSSTARR